MTHGRKELAQERNEPAVLTKDLREAVERRRSWLAALGRVVEART